MALASSLPLKRLLAKNAFGMPFWFHKVQRLAEDLGTKLYTCDKRILAGCDGLAIEPKWSRRSRRTPSRSAAERTQNLGWRQQRQL